MRLLLLQNSTHCFHHLFLAGNITDTRLCLSEGNYTAGFCTLPVGSHWLRSIVAKQQPAYVKADFHPDPFYKAYTSTEDEIACHRGEGPAGKFGAETSDCDSPLLLINATFDWVDKHLKDSIDFIIWTGDSARHDNDEQVPRTEDQIVDLNKLLVEKFAEVFGKKDVDDDPINDFTIPIIPNFGNNDILPHNIFTPGPNRWTRKYTKIWGQLIPEEQHHVFERGGYFFVEAIPNQLAIFSLNTLYFFNSNTAVDGCAQKSEPGYEQMDWLRIQLQLMRLKGMKALIIGHVPPARTENKMSWDETCWHKYTYWMEQYRDVVVGALYGHMNIDHFMLQDSKKVKDKVMNGLEATLHSPEPDDEFSVQSSAEYLSDLRAGWRKLPDSDGIELGSTAADGDRLLQGSKKRKKKPKRSKEQKFYNKIGGEWGERYSLTLVGGSVVPNYFPSMRVFEYNVTGVNAVESPSGLPQLISDNEDVNELVRESQGRNNQSEHEQLKKKPIKPKKPKYHFTPPLPPSKAAPPGPAYSRQTFTLLGYKQYFANLTTINNDFHSDPDITGENSFSPDTQQVPQETLSWESAGPSQPRPEAMDNQDGEMGTEKWHPGKHKYVFKSQSLPECGDADSLNSGKRPHPKKLHRKFNFEVEYDTRSDSVYNLTDLTVLSYIDLASRLGRYKPRRQSHAWESPVELHSRPGNMEGGDDDQTGYPRTGIEESAGQSDEVNPTTTAKKHNKKKSKKERKRAKRKELEDLWFTFVRRAYIGSKDEEYLREVFGHR